MASQVLSPKDWYQLRHDTRGWSDPTNGEPFSCPCLKKGAFGWFPPPACADVALEQLRMARIKRQDSSHVFVMPRLLTLKWGRLKQLWKACGVILSVPAGCFLKSSWEYCEWTRNSGSKRNSTVKTCRVWNLRI